MRVFDTIVRNDASHAADREPTFHFLNRCSLPEFDRVRELIEVWFAAYPDADKHALCRNLRSSRDSVFHAAFLELYCHALMQAAGYSVDVHPLEPDGKRRDFLCAKDDREMRLEATVSFAAEEEASAATRREIVVDYLNENSFVPGYRYSFDVNAEGDELPRLRKVSAQLVAWARTYDRAELRARAEAEGPGVLPVLELDSRGWRLWFQLLPRPELETERPFDIRPISIGPSSGGFWSPQASISRSLQRKAKDYSRSEVPFVIAVNAMLELPLSDKEGYVEALFGSEQITVNVTTMATRPSRVANGLWLGPGGPRNRSVSACLLVNGLRPWTITHVNPVFILNPWALHPLDPQELGLSFTEVIGGRLNEQPGPEPRAIFGLDTEWPREE